MKIDWDAYMSQEMDSPHSGKSKIKRNTDGQKSGGSNSKRMASNVVDMKIDWVAYMSQDFQVAETTHGPHDLLYKDYQADYKFIRSTYSSNDVNKLELVPVVDARSLRMNTSPETPVVSPEAEAQELSVMERAKQLQTGLEAEETSFIRVFSRADVTRSYMPIPANFWKSHMTECSEMTLEDEANEKFKVKFVASKSGFGAGWKTFANEHGLVEGEAGVFDLVNKQKFKVYIIRVDNSAVLQGSFINLEKFRVIVNGSYLNGRLGKDILAKYYDLCSGQRSYLHAKLTRAPSREWAVIAIKDTVNIAHQVNHCNHLTSYEELARWDDLLKPFEVAGMDVGFLRTQICSYMNSAKKLRENEGLKRYVEARVKRARIENDNNSLHAKLEELEKVKDRLDSKIEALEAIVPASERIFVEEACGSW